eukprot:8615109-Alexandrium_andersonii.AAC.1
MWACFGVSAQFRGGLRKFARSWSSSTPAMPHGSAHPQSRRTIWSRSDYFVSRYFWSLAPSPLEFPVL